MDGNLSGSLPLPLSQCSPHHALAKRCTVVWVVAIPELIGREPNLLVALLPKPAQEAPFTSAEDVEQAPAALGRGGIDPE